MNKTTVKGVKKPTTANTVTNAISFLTEQSIEQIETAAVVKIENADQNTTEQGVGYASATPLICQTDANGNTLEQATLHKLPFFRPQAGKAALIMDPQPGDKALAVFMKKDSSSINKDAQEPQQAASFRMFDMADGYLLNGFHGDTPEIWLHLNPVSGEISLSTKSAKIEISCRESGDIDIKTGSGNVSIEATEKVTVKAPLITLDGDVHVTGGLMVDGVAEGKEGKAFTTQGGISNQGGKIESNGVVLESHTHGGVAQGSNSTGKPNGGI